MAESTKIGRVDKYVILSRPNYAAETDPNTETTISNKFYFNRDATYAQADTASKALAALSNNTYIDTILVTNMSVNEQVAE